jgi:hypothetical protein
MLSAGAARFQELVDIEEEIEHAYGGQGRVEQIMVHDGYRGKLMGKIGLGSTFADIERHIGAVEEDEEDNLVSRDCPGLVFEIEGYFPDLRKDPAFRFAPIKEICVVSLSLPS